MTWRRKDGSRPFGEPRRLLDRWDRSDAPGFVVGVARGDQILYRRGFGLASIEVGVANTPDTRIRIGSTSKHFTRKSHAACAWTMLIRTRALQRSRRRAGRGTPGYLNYTLGKLMIMKLRGDWMRSRKGRAGLKDFHDQFLGFGGAPIPLLRRAMLCDNEPAL